MSPVITRIKQTDVFPYSSENAAGSFLKWFKDLFATDYTVLYEKELTDPAGRQETPFPSFTLDQVDTTDPNTSYFSGAIERNMVTFYIYCQHNKSVGGSHRLLRRMKDQVVFALKKAGIMSSKVEDVVIPPIRMYDFSKTPIVELNSRLNVTGSLMQHAKEEDELLEYEILVNFSYIEEN